MALDESRERALLSPSDRAYLSDPAAYVEENSRQAAMTRRNAIRERVRDGVLDMTILFESLPDSERQKIFGQPPSIHSTEDTDEEFSKLDEEERLAIGEGLRDGIAFFLLVADNIGGNPQRLVEDGVRRGMERDLGPWKAEVSLEVTTYEPERLANRARDRLESGEELTDAQVRAALEWETIDPGRLAVYLRGELPRGISDPERDDERDSHGDDTEGEE